MANTQEVRQEPNLLEVLNIKYEPNEPRLFNITKVVSITTTTTTLPGNGAPKDLNFIRRKTCVQIHEEYPNQLNFTPTAAQIMNQIFKPTNKQDIFTCDFCSTVFFSVESLEEHVVEIHVVDKEFKCSECTKTFICQDKLDSHVTEHEKEKEAQEGYKCPICSKTLARKGSLNPHMLTHKAMKPFKCKLCPNSYTRDTDLQYHEMNQHGKEKTFKCSICPKSFARNYLLQYHIGTHSNEKNIVCENCGRSYKTRHGLKSHRFYCKGTNSGNKLYKQYKCSYCDKVYRTFCHLKQHLPVHSEEKNFKCNLCQLAYKRESVLIKHFKTKHHQNE